MPMLRSRSRGSVAAVLAALFAMSGSLTAEDATDPAAQGGVLDAAREVMAAARFCSLVTLDATGHPQARIMDPFAPEDDFTVWLATNSGTRKVAQLAADERATLVYFDPQGVGYVTLLGTAEIVREPAEKARRWKEEWADFYEDGHRGEDFVLIRFRPHRLEVVSIAHQVASHPRGWKPAIVELGSRP